MSSPIDLFLSSFFYIFFYLYFSKFSLSKKKHFYFLCTVQWWYSVYITHVFDGATYKNYDFFHDWLLTETTKATKTSEMRTQEAEKINTVRMDCQWTPLFFPFSQPERKAPHYLCFSLSIKWISLWTCSNVKSSCQSIRLAEQHQLQSPRQQKCFFTA